MPEPTSPPQPESVEPSVRQVHALTGLIGPPGIEDRLAEIRRAAPTGEPAGLALLAELIELSADDDPDFARADELYKSAQAALPAGWEKVVTAAALGRLAVDPALDADSADPRATRPERDGAAAGR
ncbi:hypothetical protein DPM19_03865 [Actinomadura craniellae]|uniref:Uncharacterized protein n=1 Tax=Actinomadura craniellae TaxID=2231787 RepID=A0A365HAB7_9ACTN|nr:hypothetical protein [Actinomadura craniellae]RAY16080.1 hypothetical protein DPM19_03865 [Actinomadura craniellae]